jgi:hypothetical protein
MEEQAILKFNDGAGALLCSGCNRIISTGSSFTEKEWMAMQGKLDLPPQYCKDCREVSKNGNNETVTDGHGLTAVEWLAEQMLHPESFNPYIEQAKAMERRQIADAMMYALDEDGHSLQWRTKFVEKYYTETYNK